MDVVWPVICTKLDGRIMGRFVAKAREHTVDARSQIKSKTTCCQLSASKFRTDEDVYDVKFSYEFGNDQLFAGLEAVYEY